MKKGDYVYVNWPTGRGGPYEIDYLEEDVTKYVIILMVEGTLVGVPDFWCEPEKPNIEEGRLVIGTAVVGGIVYGLLSYKDEGPYIGGKRVLNNNIYTIHRRWGEWTKKEMDSFNDALNDYCEGDIDSGEVMKIAYKNITREEHP